MFEKLQQKNIHDPKWLERGEQQLRAHIRQHPIAPKTPMSPWLAAVIIAIGVVVFMLATRSAEPVPSASPTPTRVPTATVTPVISATPTPTTTITPIKITTSPTPDSTPRKTPPPVLRDQM